MELQFSPRNWEHAYDFLSSIPSPRWKKILSLSNYPFWQHGRDLPFTSMPIIWTPWVHLPASAIRWRSQAREALGQSLGHQLEVPNSLHTDFSKTWQSQWYKSLVILYLFGIQQDAVEHDATRGWNSHFSLNPWPRPPSQAAKGGNARWWEALPLGVESIQCPWREDIARAGAIQWPTWRQVMRWCFRVISWDVGRCWH